MCFKLGTCKKSFNDIMFTIIVILSWSYVSYAFAPINLQCQVPTNHYNTNNIQHFHYLEPLLKTSTTLSASPADSKSAASNQNAFGLFSDAVTGVIFSILHAFDDCDIKDSSKNLRVLWVRALLNYRNKIDDTVAQELLPKTTRGLVTSSWGASLLDPILKFAEWIEARTDFIDTGLDNFLSSPGCHDANTNSNLTCNVVLFGAGYDTRALRYRHKHSGNINFIEVDLPEVVEGKFKLYEQYQREHDPSWKFGKQHALVPFDLNDCGGAEPKSLIEELRNHGEKILRDDHLILNFYY